MNISLENNSDLSAIIHVNIQESDYIDLVNKQLSDYRKTASIPGFRPGKVPMGMIKKKYSVAITADEVNKKVSQSLNEYLIENKINLLGEPMANIEKMGHIDFEEQKDFDYFFDIALAPEIDVEFINDLKLPYYEIMVADEELNKTIEDIKTRFGNEELVDLSENTDALHGQLFKLDENAKRNDEDQGKTRYIKVIDVVEEENKKKYIGLKKGDVITVNLKEDIGDVMKIKHLLEIEEDADEALSANYEFVIDSIHRPTTAELGEELYKNVFPSMEIATEEDFRKQLVEELKKQSAKQSDEYFLDNAMTTIIDRADFQLPDAFLKRWILENNRDTLTAEKIEEDYKNYSATFKWQLVEEKLKAKFGDEARVNEADIRNRIADYFKVYSGGELSPQLDAIIDQVLSNQDEKEKIRRELQGLKMITVLKKNITLENEEVTHEKFNELVTQLNEKYNG